MRVLLVYCHPVAESYCAALRDCALAALRVNGHEVRVLDLYGENFDPVMRADERRSYNDGEVARHPFPAHAAHLRWAQALLLVYPTWWYGLPAMLKGWIDRVWTPGVAFEISGDNGAIRPLLTHITQVGVITTCGAPRWWSFVVGHPGKRLVTRGLRALFARRCRSFFMAHYLMDVSTPNSRAAFLGAVEQRLRRF